MTLGPHGAIECRSVNEQSERGTMSEAFSDAAARHFADAEHLLQDRRLENADQLYGLAAECALKTALISPPKHQNAGKLPDAFFYHINELWDRVGVGSIPRQFAPLQALLRKENPFVDWAVEQRYAAGGFLVEESLERHRSAARRLLGAAHIVGQRQES